MEIFSATLSQMAFLFSLIVLGFVLAKLKVIPDNTASVIAKLENYIFIPALVLGTFMNNFTMEKIPSAWRLLLFSFAFAIVMLICATFTSKILSKDNFIRKICTYGLAFPNFGYMGNAVVLGLFPALFTDYLIFTLPLWTLIYLYGVPVLLIPEDGGLQLMSRRARILSRIKSFANPMFVCMLIGIVLGLTGVGAKLPLWVSNVVTTSGNCMSPLAMLLTGITVSHISLKKTFTNVSIYVISFVKLVIYPLVFIGIAHFLPLTDTMFICAVCAIAMPLGLNTIVIPSAYGKDSTVAAGMAIISHLISCITIPLVFMLI